MTEQEKFMKSALRLAKKAAAENEVPIGAIVVCDGKIVGRGYNKRTKMQMATKHAEILAIEQACRKFSSWRLPDCEIYITLEPCPMCLGAVLNARIRKVYFGASEKKGRSLTYEIANCDHLNHKVEIEGGLLAEECSAVLSDYFRSMREREAKKKTQKSVEKTAEEKENASEKAEESCENSEKVAEIRENSDES